MRTRIYYGRDVVKKSVGKAEHCRRWCTLVMPGRHRKKFNDINPTPEGVQANQVLQLSSETSEVAPRDAVGGGQKIARRWKSAEEAVRRLQADRGLPTEVPTDEYPLEFLQTITEMSHPDIYAKLPEAISREVRRRTSRSPQNIKFCCGVSKIGERCGGIAQKGYELCNWHRGLLLTIQEGRDLARLRGNRRSTTDVLREVVEESFQEDLVAVPLDALSAVKTERLEGGELVESTVPDHDIRLKAFNTITDRIDGKATQTTHLRTTGGTPLALEELMSDATDPEVMDVEYEELTD